MGRKVSNKTNIKKEQIKEGIPKGLSAKKRAEINQLVDKLLKISTIPTQQNVPKILEMHTEIDEIVTKILNIESSIDFSPVSRTSGAIIKNFVKWMRENGAKFDNLSITEFPGYDLGLKADRDIEEGSLMMAVPRKTMITLESANKSVIGPLIQKDKMLQNMPNVALAMILLVEKFTTNSFWKPYIDILPPKYSTVLYFTKEELLELKESPIFISALNLIKSIVRQYAYFHKLIQVADDPAAELLRGVFTYDQYRWAVSTIMTRQNSVPSEDGSHMINALIPLWDLCNHTNGNISTDYNRDEQRTECMAVRDFRVGEQIFIFYGVRSNADLFLHNGFVYEQNIHDGYWLKLGISKSDKLHEKRAALLLKINVPVHGEFWLRPGSEPIDGLLLAFVRVFNMNEAQLDHWLSSDRSTDLQYQDCALETDLEIKTWTFLQTRLKLVLSTYKTTIAEDAEIITKGNLSHCKKLAIQMRSSEKKILQGALNYIDERIKN